MFMATRLPDRILLTAMKVRRGLGTESDVRTIERLDSYHKRRAAYFAGRPLPLPIERVA